MTETTLETIAAEEERLVFDRFDVAAAWDLGSRLRAEALCRGGAVTIDITVNGRCLFYCAMPGTTQDNDGWIERKRAVAARFERSSWYMKHLYAAKNTTIAEKSLLSERDYAAFGGSVPLRLRGAGVIGTVTVSGLPQADDHRLVIDVVASMIGGS